MVLRTSMKPNKNNLVAPFLKERGQSIKQMYLYAICLDVLQIRASSDSKALNGELAIL